VSWLVFLGILVALGVGYGLLSFEIGPRAAARRFSLRVFLVVAFVLFAFEFFRALPAAEKAGTWSALLLLLSAVCWASLLFRLRRKWQAGAVLLDLGRLPRQRLFILGAGLLGSAGILRLVEVPRALEQPIAGSLFGAFALSFALYFLILGLYRLEVRERGILGFFGLVAWERIESYRWEGETLTVWVRRRRFPWLRDMSWRIPPAHKDQVATILAQRVPSPRAPATSA